MFVKVLALIIGIPTTLFFLFIFVMALSMALSDDPQIPDGVVTWAEEHAKEVN